MSVRTYVRMYVCVCTYPELLHVAFTSALGDPLTLNFTVKLAPTFPLDVYFIMDFSGTMRNDLQSLSDISGSVGKYYSSKLCHFAMVLSDFLSMDALLIMYVYVQYLP